MSNVPAEPKMPQFQMAIFQDGNVDYMIDFRKVSPELWYARFTYEKLLLLEKKIDSLLAKEQVGIAVAAERDKLRVGLDDVLSVLEEYAPVYVMRKREEISKVEKRDE